MSIALYENTALAFHVIELNGRLSLDEFRQLGATHAQHRAWAGADTIHIVRESADVSALTPEHIDILRQHYRSLHSGLDLHIIRRAAWLCSSAPVWRLLEYWLVDRHSRDEHKTEVVLAANLDDIHGVFDAAECAAVREWTGFRLLHRIGDPPDARLAEFRRA